MNNNSSSNNNPFAFDNESVNGDDHSDRVSYEQGVFNDNVSDDLYTYTNSNNNNNYNNNNTIPTIEVEGANSPVSPLRNSRLSRLPPPPPIPQPPQVARISESPTHGGHIRNNSNVSMTVDPFNFESDNEDNASSASISFSDSHTYQDTNDYQYQRKPNNDVDVDIYEHTNNSTATNFLTTPLRNNSSYNYDYSPSDSFNQLGYYSPNQSQQQYFINHNETSASSPIFQNFERDSDEPEMINNERIFDNNGTTQENNVLNHLNIADKCDNKVELIDGKYYSFDYPVPDQLLTKIPFEPAKQMTEFTHLRYHAITADPKDYSDENPLVKEYIENYPLREKVYAVKRETELMIVCTMYNEDEILLGRTLKGVFKNIKTMYNLKENENVHPFGRNSWKNIVVVIVSDGKNKINPKSKALLTLLGAFQEGLMQESVNDETVNAHLFEYTTTFGIGKFNHTNNSVTVPLVTEQTIPVQIMFLLKEENKQKINSHRWALNFLCPNLNPKVVVLLDVGTEPGPDSIYKLWKAFKDPKVGGACGEIRAMLGDHASPNDETSIWNKLIKWLHFKVIDFATCFINPLIAAQNFEYKMSNILDKPMESAFGFVTVLPGAFSAYRYEALQGDPLKAYFHGEDMKINNINKKPAGILESNMYLAEDRILCFELIAKNENPYLLKYVHNSYAITDVPSQINEFINQRRRWLNGSFFAALYSILHFYRILASKHSIGRKIALVIEVIYQTVNILFSWFSLSIYFLVFRILTTDVTDTFVGEKVGDILSIVFLWVYIASMVLTFIISFGNKPNDARFLYMLAFALLATVVIYMTFCVIALTIQSVNDIKESVASSTSAMSTAAKFLKNEKFRDLTVSLASTYALYIVGSLIFFDVFHLFACTLQYILLSPAYINVLSVYAFCNMNDISWGTKGALGNDKPKKQANNKAKQTDGDDDEKNVLLLSENMENPDVLYKKAQKFLESTENDDDDAIEKDDGLTDEERANKMEQEQIEANIKKSERNYAMGRTYTVLIWLVSNFILLVIVLRTGGLEDYSEYVQGDEDNTASSYSSSSSSSSSYRLLKRDYWNNNDVANIFMAVILWTVAALALIRLSGTVYYRVKFFIDERKHHRSAVLADVENEEE